MESKPSLTPVPGWIGGFAESKPEFAYPTPNLKALALLDNMANIDKLDRQQAVLWPEFSWETQRGEKDPKRCYQMFARDISRLGYTNKGRVYSIICPQQGFYSPAFGALNVEVTVTGQRGWVNETTKEIAADMKVVGKIWFSPSATQGALVKLLWDKFESSKLPFPSNKANAIVVTTHFPGNPKQIAFPLRTGESKTFPIPEFARHPREAWSVGNLEVQIGKIKRTKSAAVNKFNQLILNVFNIASGNMLQEGNILAWNVWFTAPEYVDRVEWRAHAELWRKSIDADHRSPGGDSTPARYFNGKEFKPLQEVKEDIDKEILKIIVNAFK